MSLAQAWETYLGSGVVPGVGRGLAARLAARFGEAMPRVLDQEPARLREVVRPATAEALARWWRAERRRACALVQLVGLGLSPALARRAYAAWGAEAEGRVAADPYRLMAVPGIGWATADAVARAQGMGPTDPRRIRAAGRAVLEEALADGHCCLTEDTWRRRVGERVGVAEPPSGVVASDAGWLVDNGLVHLPSVARAEREIEAEWRRLIEAGIQTARPWTAADEQVFDTTLTPAQRRAIQLALREPISVLTGLPGTGKTTAVRTAVRAAQARGERVALLAPTGKAARRLEEAVGMPAQTVHRALGWRPGPGGARVVHDAAHPLPADLVIVDEASMLDVWLARQLLRAIPSGARLWLVGDAAQLPSVGPGRVLADAIDYGGVSVTVLTEIHRQAASSPIVRLAHAVHEGRWPEVAAWRDPACAWYPASGPHLATLVAELAAAARHAGEELQVLAPLRGGPDGLEALNAAIRARLNPGRDEETGLRPGDRVVATRNNPELQVVNGEQGMVRRVTPGGVEVEMDGRSVVYAGAARRELELAYAMTVHKAQGSEWPAVCVVLTARHYVLLERALLYTALTRARRRLVLVGEEWAFRVAASRANDSRRGTCVFRWKQGDERWENGGNLDGGGGYWD